jgi:DNA/RNA endonuclease G (NUC1)
MNELKPEISKVLYENYRVINRHGVAEKTICKLCGATVSSLVPTEKGQWTEKKGNQTIIYQPTIEAPTNSYSVIEILMEDGSKHQTPLCRECSSKPLTVDQLQSIYDADVKRFEETGMDVEMYRQRKPLAMRKIQ